MNTFHNITRNIRIKKSRIYSTLMQISHAHLFIHPHHYTHITDKPRILFPSEYSLSLIAKSHMTTLKSSARKILIKDIPDVWQSSEFSRQEKLELHSFGWLSLLDIDMDRQWLKLIRNHIKFWMKNFDDTHFSWEATSERIYNWIKYYNLISKTSDTEFIKKFTRSILYQMKCLQKIMYLTVSPVNKVSIIRTIIVAYGAVDRPSVVKKALQELCDYINHTDCVNSVKSTYDFVKLLRYLIDIESMCCIYQQDTPEISVLISKVAGIIEKIKQADGGICLFQSIFTPTPAYINTLLSYTKYTIADNNSSGYFRLNTIDAQLFVNLRNKQLSMEFSNNNQRVILGTYFAFPGNIVCSNWSEVEYHTSEEFGGTQFYGKSMFIANDHQTVFSRELYINTLGTELRCEEKFSTRSLDITRYITFPGNAKITLLEYQNGFSITLSSGIKWIWICDYNAEIFVESGYNCMINGEISSVTLVSVSTNTNENNTLSWRFKKNLG